MHPILIAEVIKKQENHSNLRNRLKCLDFDNFWDNLRLFCDQNPVISGKMIDNSRDQCKLTGKDIPSFRISHKPCEANGNI